MACIDTRLFNDFFRDNNNLQKSFMDFLKYVYTRDSSMVEKNKDGKIVAVCAEIDIDVSCFYQLHIRQNLLPFKKFTCENIVFKEKVKFDKCEFKGKVSFKNCTFKKQVIFSNSSFEYNVYFNNSTFEDYADFHECEFEKVACFYGVKFQKVPNFSTCYFKEQKAVNLVNMDINNLDFRKVEKFINENYKDKAYQEDQSEKKEQKYKLRYAQNAKDSFRIIKDVLIEQNNILEAQEWHKLELYAREKELEISLEKNNPIQSSSKLEKKEKFKKITLALVFNAILTILNNIKDKIGYFIEHIPIFFGCLLFCCILFPMLLFGLIMQLVIDFFAISFYITLNLLIQENFLLFMTRFIKYKTIKIYRIGKNMQDYTTWVNCVLLQLYRNTSDHHTNFVKILNFTAGMITLYAGLCYAFIKHIDILNSIDFSDFLFLSSYCVIIIILFSYSIVRKKFLMLSLAMFFIIFAFLFFESMTFLNSKPIEVFFLMVYFLGIIIFYIFFICKIKIIIFFVRVLSYMVFLGVIILKPQLINPFIGIFSSDKLFESKFERKLSDLNSSTIINLAKISQKNFILLNEYQKEHNISFTELNSVKTTIITNKIELNNILSYLFDKKKIDNFEKILTTLENNRSDLISTIKNIDNKNNNSAMFLDMKKLLNLDFIDRIDERIYSIIRYFPCLSITPKDEEYQIFESQENQTKLKNILSIIKLDDKLKLQSIKQIIDCDKILSDTIKSTSVIYSIILLLCIFSLQKTARKNSIIPS